ncbi:hypothetical protein ACFE04_020454 [Oxalis oulophora]
MEDIPSSPDNYSRIIRIRPIAVPLSLRARFSIKGINLLQPGTRLLCAVEGKYLAQEIADHVVDSSREDNNEIQETIVDSSWDADDELQCVHFTCSVPTLTGRGFIEFEDNGFLRSYFPFIVAEEDVCSEIRMLESALELSDDSEGKSQALDFIHAMSRLLHRSHLKSRLSHPFPSSRFKWMVVFAVDHDWCGVVRKLLTSFLDGTIHHTGSRRYALSDMGLLHRAVRKNSHRVVEFLLRYRVPEELEIQTEEIIEVDESYLFKADAVCPAGLTPLHIAAGNDGSEAVLNALTDDPDMVGIEVWKSARDSAGFTPEDYASQRRHYSYIQLIQEKISKRHAVGHVTVDIPDSSSQNVVTFEIEAIHELTHETATTSPIWRPVMLSMVAIAAVCVSVSLLFTIPQKVKFVNHRVLLEILENGPI